MPGTCLVKSTSYINFTKIGKYYWKMQATLCKACFHFRQQNFVKHIYTISNDYLLSPSFFTALFYCFGISPRSVCEVTYIIIHVVLTCRNKGLNADNLRTIKILGNYVMRPSAPTHKLVNTSTPNMRGRLLLSHMRFHLSCETKCLIKKRVLNTLVLFRIGVLHFILCQNTHCLFFILLCFLFI